MTDDELVELCAAIGERDILRARVAELERTLGDVRANLTAEGHSEQLRIQWALNHINCAIN